MRKAMLLFLSLLLLFSVTYNVAAAANESTEQKYQTLKSEGIFTGFSDGSSRLYESMTREQFAVVLARLYDLDDNARTALFGDVERTRWSFHEIQAVAKAGLMNGVSGKKFSPTTNVTVEQLAAILVRATGYTSRVNSAFVGGNVSAWARDVVRIALDRGLIDSMNDYTVNATRGMLVEAVYSIYQDIHPKPIILTKVEALTSSSIRITLGQPISNADISRIKLTDFYGNILKVGVSSISNDGLSITLWTDRMINGILHTLTIGDNVSWGFLSKVDDTVKPTVTSVRALNGYSIQVTFSEPVDQDSATNTNNYRLNNGLRVSRAQLTSSTTVVLTTNDQADGQQYQLTVRNVKDLAGNTMDNSYTTISTDYSKPKVNSVQVNATATLTVKFSEPVNRNEAERTSNYTIDKGLRVTQATLAGDNRTVTLKTTEQRDGELYKLTVSGISDLSGNYMDSSTNWKFGGVADPEIPVVFNAIKAINNNTVEIGFNRAITDADVAKLKVYLLSDNGNDVSMADWSQAALRKDDKTVTVQFRTKTNANPKLFVPGHYYLAKVDGVASLATSDDQDEREFAGISVDNPVPYVKEIYAIGEDRVKVVFSEPVRGVDETAFAIRQLDGKNVAIDYDEVNDTNKIVTEAVLRLKDDMPWDWQYIVTFKPNVITDTAKFNGLKTTDGDKPIEIMYKANW